MKTKDDATVDRARRAWTCVTIGLLTIGLTGGVPARAASLQSTVTSDINGAVKSLTGKTLLPTTTQTSSSAIQALNKFLAGGPNKWSVEAPYPIPPGLKSDVIGSNGDLLDTPLAQYLVWKRDQAPTYFDAHHKGLAAAMQHNDLLRQEAQIQSVEQMIQTAQTANSSTSAATTTAATTSTTSTTGTSTTTQAAQTLAAQTLVSPAPVPEPASIATTLLLFGAAVIWQRRQLRASV